MELNELLSIDTPDASVTLSGATACLLLIGDGASTLATHLCDAAKLTRRDGAARVLFGLPVMTLPYPILVSSLMTERNTRFDQLSLFGWVEDNAILEPRAEVIGLTPAGDEPVLFVRDLDLDRPPECYIQPAPAKWTRIAGVVIARNGFGEQRKMLHGADAVLGALEVVLPANWQSLVTSLRSETVTGKDLRHILRARRRSVEPEIMSLCDGWRVLARAARFIAAGPSDVQVLEGFRLDAIRRW
ncbi:MAG TPA: hypothetical protein VGK87_07965 [Anaerolineae bacterium]|jgi:hypothetical protein